MSCSENLAESGEQVAVWIVRPFQLVSLLEMLQVHASDFIELHISIRLLEMQAREYAKATPYNAPTEFEKQYIEMQLGKIGVICAKFELEHSLDQIARLKTTIRGRLPYTNQHALLAEELRDLQRRIEDELKKRLFMFISTAQAEFYDKPKPFGQKVYRNFKSTRNDVMEAMNCFAVGRYTASVFHCMRVLEKGLHALVHNLNNTFGTAIHFSKAVEDTNWGTIIPKIESEITELLKPTRKPRLSKSDLQFYSETAKEFVYFQKAWRDDVSHSRSSYDPNEAKVVMVHVEAFMQHLSTRLHE